MVADINVMRITTSSCTLTDITTACTRVSTSDSPTPATANPIPIPSSGSNYAFFASTILYAACAPDNSINNIKHYSDGGNGFGTGVSAFVVTASQYEVATGTAGSSGIILSTACHAGLDGSPSPMFDFSSGCKMPVAGSIASTTGSFADHVVLQISVDTTGSPGNSGEETMTWEFDET
jgi:hypothetical protein